MVKNNVKKQHKLNEELSCYENLRLVGDNVIQGVYPYSYCFSKAEELELDLVCITESAQPPVCKIIDYQKFLYQEKRKEKDKKQGKVEIKEIKFSPQIGENDFQVKLKQAEKFLKEGHKVKAYVMFSGRQIVYKKQGENVLNKFISNLSDISNIEVPIKMEGNRKLSVLLNPHKKK